MVSINKIYGRFDNDDDDSINDDDISQSIKEEQVTKPRAGQ